jgi:hypothetical protein
MTEWSRDLKTGKETAPYTPHDEKKISYVVLMTKQYLALALMVS